MNIGHDWVDVDTLSGMTPPRNAVFSLGSNLDDRLSALQRAVTALADTSGLSITGVSGVYETVAVGPVDQPEFLNIVVLASSTLASNVMLDRCLAIENALGRVRTAPQGPRVIDVDLVAVGDRVTSNDRLTLPHPRAHERAFVLVPWLEIDPEACLVGHGKVADIVAALDVSGVTRRDDVAIDLT